MVQSQKHSHNHRNLFVHDDATKPCLTFFTHVMLFVTAIPIIPRLQVFVSPNQCTPLVFVAARLIRCPVSVCRYMIIGDPYKYAPVVYGIKSNPHVLLPIHSCHKAILQLRVNGDKICVLFLTLPLRVSPLCVRSHKLVARPVKVVPPWLASNI